MTSWQESMHMSYGNYRKGVFRCRAVTINLCLVFTIPCNNTVFSQFFFQNNLERQEYETRSRLTGQIDVLEQEVTVLKRNLTSEQEQNTKLVESLKVGQNSLSNERIEYNCQMSFNPASDS